MSPRRSIVVHGHFYQPPREDPWTGEIPEQPSAAPFHDWNERITHECYEAIVGARLLAANDSVERRMNVLESMSFNFGPTLLEWLEPNAPETYAAILAADRASIDRLGRGNAIAMPFHHPILPLSTPRDRRTEVRWGIADFERRFGRAPEGMWLPETAVDTPTLEALAREGIRFTILAPHQVDPVPEAGRPGLFITPEGREIALFVYDGSLAHGVAFGNLLRDGVAWANLMAEEEGDALRSLATDGETFGHHHTFGEMALARAFETLQSRDDVFVENYASYLAREGAHERVSLVEPTAWSCAHGVDRWQAECGCAANPSAGLHQKWRGPLRRALGWLADELHDVFDAEGPRYFDDPWAARDELGGGPTASFVPSGIRSGASRTTEVVPAGFSAPASAPLPARAAELLEMERNALRLFTSCAWFFDDVGSLEPTQVLAYAVRAVELSGASDSIRPELLRRLDLATSNDPEIGSAADIFSRISEHGSVAGAIAE